MARIVVTGGSGKLGRACVTDLLEHGYDIVNIDTALPAQRNCPFVKTDLEDLGQTIEALSQVDDRFDGVDGVVHLAAIPAPGLQPNGVLFRTNTMTTYNVFEAARRLKIRNVVWASSETLLGLPLDIPPQRIPIDEECEPRPETAYSLSKLVGEEMAKQFCRWDRSSRSSACGSRTSSSRPNTVCFRLMTSRPRANGICGAISMHEMVRRQYGVHSKHR
jgi:nucleoside-diphosphate-sugar epimerase